MTQFKTPDEPVMQIDLIYLLFTPRSQPEDLTEAIHRELFSKSQQEMLLISYSAAV